ncbi:hypothetical protein FIBSPDRAFT_1038859 [Athelia psychrophila]|uniref:Uncharacterized protein n=1 Tax=Athelia psychrophila TaxID=1759441 RepID=A0A166SJL6_9AGAM|nr:hypothetical protein FIBSPDRAFT_1038859 [Fibularhizoctonia sp. CBS 109695]
MTTLANRDMGANHKGVFTTFKSRFLRTSLWSANNILPPRSTFSSSSASHKPKVPSTASDVALSSQSSSSSSAASGSSRFPASTSRGSASSVHHGKSSTFSKKPPSQHISTYSTTSRGSQASSGSRGNRAPTPPSMYPSFGFEGPIKKPRPLPLDPQKTRHRPDPRDGKQPRSALGGWTRSGQSRQRDSDSHSSKLSVGLSSHYPSTTASQILCSAFGDELSTCSDSSVSSFQTDSLTGATEPHWRSDVDSLRRLSSCATMRSGDVPPLSLPPTGTQVHNDRPEVP